MGGVDISGIGDGTVTGAIADLQMKTTNSVKMFLFYTNTGTSNDLTQILLNNVNISIQRNRTLVVMDSAGIGIFGIDRYLKPTDNGAVSLGSLTKTFTYNSADDSRKISGCTWYTMAIAIITT